MDRQQGYLASACGTTTVIGGAFTVTESLCGGEYWGVDIQGVDGGISCGRFGPTGDITITPADCMCFTDHGPDLDPDHAASSGCVDRADGGADGDASADAQDGS